MLYFNLGIYYLIEEQLTSDLSQMDRHNAYRSSSLHVPSQRDEKVAIRAVDDKQLKLSQHHISLSYRYECYNFTGHAINTLDHTGVFVRHEPTTTAPELPEYVGCFVVAKIYTASDKTQIVDYSPSNSIDHILDNDSEEKKRSNKFFTSEIVKRINQRTNKLSRKTSMHYIAVKYGDLMRNRGSVYLKDADLVVATATITDTIVHPNSQKALDLKIEQLYDAAHTYTVEINDVNCNGQPYYINLNDQVYAIYPTMDRFVGDTIKITFKPPNQPAQVIYAGVIDENELKKVGIFKNYSDADNYGTRLEIQKEKLVEENQMRKLMLENQKVETAMTTTDIKAKTEALSADSEMQKLMMKIDLMEKERVAESEKIQRTLSLEREKHARDLEDMRARDYYERRSYERKDTSEGIKTTHVMLASAVALFAYMNK